jgi:hypothetical protein
MEARKLRIVGAETDEGLDSFERSPVDHPQDRPLRFRRAFVEADPAQGETDEDESVLQPKLPRHGKIKQPPLTKNVTSHGRADASANGAHHTSPVESRAAPPDEAPLNEAFAETAQQMRKLSADLLLSAAATTASLAELAANAITLLGRTTLLFPGQFIHTGLLSLFQRLIGQEQHYEEAFARNWKVYRNILVAKHQVGLYEIPFAFVVGLSLMLPLLLLKFLELLNSFIRLFRP